jgi:hypothetical protein
MTRARAGDDAAKKQARGGDALAQNPHPKNRPMGCRLGGYPGLIGGKCVAIFQVPFFCCFI